METWTVILICCIVGFIALLAAYVYANYKSPVDNVFGNNVKKVFEKKVNTGNHPTGLPKSTPMRRYSTFHPADVKIERRKALEMAEAGGATPEGSKVKKRLYYKGDILLFDAYNEKNRQKVKVLSRTTINPPHIYIVDLNGLELEAIENQLSLVEVFQEGDIVLYEKNGIKRVAKIDKLDTAHDTGDPSYTVVFADDPQSSGRETEGQRLKKVANPKSWPKVWAKAAAEAEKKRLAEAEKKRLAEAEKERLAEAARKADAPKTPTIVHKKWDEVMITLEGKIGKIYDAYNPNYPIILNHNKNKHNKNKERTLSKGVDGVVFKEDDEIRYEYNVAIMSVTKDGQYKIIISGDEKTVAGIDLKPRENEDHLIKKKDTPIQDTYWFMQGNDPNTWHYEKSYQRDYKKDILKLYKYNKDRQQWDRDPFGRIMTNMDEKYALLTLEDNLLREMHYGKIENAPIHNGAEQHKAEED